MFDWVINMPLIVILFFLLILVFWSLQQKMRTLMKIQDFSAQEFLQNCYCLELFKIRECVTLLLKRLSPVKSK